VYKLAPAVDAWISQIQGKISQSPNYVLNTGLSWAYGQSWDPLSGTWVPEIAYFFPGTEPPD